MPGGIHTAGNSSQISDGSAAVLWMSADKARQRELKTILRDLPRAVELWTGGRGAERHASIIRPRGLILSDYNSYQQELVRLGGRVA